MLSGHGTLIGIKRMGLLDEKAIHKACKQRFPAEEANLKAGIFCSTWQSEISNSDWHPFRIVTADGEPKVGNPHNPCTLLEHNSFVWMCHVCICYALESECAISQDSLLVQAENYLD